jgi:alpha-galactosidase
MAYVKHLVFYGVLLLYAASASAQHAPPIEAGAVRIELTGSAEALWRLSTGGTEGALVIGAPTFPIEGRATRAVPLRLERIGTPEDIGRGVIEHRVGGPLRDDPALALEIRYRVSPATPVVRFQYVLRATQPRALSRAAGEDETVYLDTSFEALPRATEVRLSEFVEFVHSYLPSERPVDARGFAAGVQAVGPLLMGSDGRRTALLGYEHGSQVPDAFLRFDLGPGRSVRLRAVKGTYLRGQIVDAHHPFESVWLQAAVVPGDEDATAAAYRAFVRSALAAPAALAPRIHYNTWNFQERNRWVHGKPYLDSMNQARMLEEIDIAHRMGIETFVIDTGWYEKTGDWAVSRARFPGGLAPIVEKLAASGMALGLWFDPTAAALTSRAYLANQAYRMSSGGKTYRQPIWETEESYRMCLISPWAETFLREQVRLAGETGVTYFKWDAVGQYGCDAPGHGHGDDTHTPSERRDRYAFQLPLRLTEIARRLGEQVPGALVDFDVTEGGRAVGLAFLTAGRYFLINNGPYYQNYDVPIDPANDNWNLFFHPGPARTWITRSAYAFDRWIPSELFLAHYFPDDQERSLDVNLASLVLGHHGIWGDLPAVSAAGVARIARVLALWRQVRDAMVGASPVRAGVVGGVGEVHEKIDIATGRGAVVIFSTRGGPQRYVSARPADRRVAATGEASVTFDPDGHAIVDVPFGRPGAVVVFFGAAEP